jgi:peroxiredoxin
VRVTVILVTVNLLFVIPCKAWPAEPFPGIDPYWILLHEPAVIEELKLSKSQRQAFQKQTDDLDLRVFPLRNKSRDEMLPELTKVFSDAQQAVGTILQPAQEKQLNEIYMRRLGTIALLRDAVAAKMRYSDTQRKEIEKIIADTQTSVTALEKEASEGKPREPLEKRFVALKTDEQKRILKLLKPNQQKAWRDLVDTDFDMTKLGQPIFKAPELVDTNEWINSAPLRLEDLRGKVVVVHFYACGCSNCIHNYPWYHQWHDAFKDKGVVLIGIHTPETASERDSANVRRKAAAEKFEFPVLIDGKNENWNAWGNSMWPSVYLIDKRGYLRQFWPGELNWQGNNGEKYMREWIEKLLAEPST